MRRSLRADGSRRGSEDASGLRYRVLVAAALLGLGWSRGAQAAETGSFTLQMPDGPVLVEHAATDGDGPRQAVIVLSGSKGFGSAAYDEMGRKFGEAGLDVFALDALTRADIDTIAKAGSAHARIAYYAARLPQWTAAVLALVARLDAEPRHAHRIGILGISLGAQIAAAAAAADRGGVRALVLVDGGFPAGSAPPARALPPLMLIWGGADRVFPPAVARALAAEVRSRGGKAVLKVYDGGSHDFFVRPGAVLAARAQTEAAAFLGESLR